MDRDIILGLRRKVSFDLVVTSQIPVFQEHLVFQIIVYLQSSIMPKGEKAFISLRFPFGKGFYFFDTTAPGSRVQAVGGESPAVAPRWRPRD